MTPDESIEPIVDVGGGPPAATPEPDSPAHPAPRTAPPLSRRRALQVLGAVPFAGASILAQQPPAPQQPVQPHTTPNQPAADTKQPPASQPRSHFFNQREVRTLRALADDIIPRDERSGSATEAGVIDFIDYNLSVEETDDATRVAWRGGLRWLDTESRNRFSVGYAAATTLQRHAILDDIAYPDRVRPETRYGATFFGRARDMVAAAFFSSAIGHKDLRYMGNVFNPNWQGCPEEAMRKLGVSHEVMNSRIAPQG